MVQFFGSIGSPTENCSFLLPMMHVLKLMRGMCLLNVLLENRNGNSLLPNTHSLYMLFSSNEREIIKKCSGLHWSCMMYIWNFYGLKFQRTRVFCAIPWSIYRP